MKFVMDDLLRYAFEDVRRRRLLDPFVGATQVATGRSGVEGFRKGAWGGKVHPDSGFICGFKYIRFHLLASSWRLHGGIDCGVVGGVDDRASSNPWVNDPAYLLLYLAA